MSVGDDAAPHPFRRYNSTLSQGRAGGGAAGHGRIGRIVVRGEFGPVLASVLPDCEVAGLSGETHVTMRVRDEAELLGVLARLRDLGAGLVSVSIDP